MQAINLPLFSIDNSTNTPYIPNSEKQAQQVPKVIQEQEQVLIPLTEILDKVAVQPPKNIAPSESLPQSISNSLNSLFPEQQYDDKDIQKAKQILGDVANQFSSEELKVVVTEIQYLVSTWIDDFEKEIFDGKTLRELLHEKGSL
jgi:hypothetical protein